MEKLEYLDYTEYGKLISVLSIQCANMCRVYNLKYVYGIPRGGLPIAVHLAHSLNLMLISELRENLYPVLVVDDIADSGDTLRKILQVMPVGRPRSSVQIATLFYKNTSKIIPDCYARTTKKWVVFPWESDIYPISDHD